MNTPEGKLGLEKLLKDALVKSFPGLNTAVEYQGVTDHDVMWLITVGQASRQLTQRETTVLLQGHAEEFKRYFGSI